MSERSRNDTGLTGLHEVTVAGAIGPVLRAMTEPAASSAGLHTILRVRADDDQDLVDVLDLFESRGIDVTTISVVG